MAKEVWLFNLATGEERIAHNTTARAAVQKACGRKGPLVNSLGDARKKGHKTVGCGDWAAYATPKANNWAVQQYKRHRR